MIFDSIYVIYIKISILDGFLKHCKGLCLDIGGGRRNKLLYQLNDMLEVLV